jgi:hypothetical protein
MGTTCSTMLDDLGRVRDHRVDAVATRRPFGHLVRRFRRRRARGLERNAGRFTRDLAHSPANSPAAETRFRRSMK